MVLTEAEIENLNFKSLGQSRAGSNRSKRYSVSFLLVASFFLTCALPARLTAQAAQFLGYQTTVTTSVNEPTPVAIDKAGNLYVGNAGAPALVKIPAGGGTPIPISLPNNDSVTALAVDSNDNLYVCLTNDQTGMVIKMPAQGGSSTQLGSGWQWPVGVAVDSAGDVFVTDSNLQQVFELPVAGGQVQLNFSNASYVGNVAVDAAGDVFVPVIFTNQVAELPAGASTPISLTMPDTVTAVAVDPAGNVFATLANSGDGNTGQIVELPAGGGSVITLGATGLEYPYGVTLDGTDNLFITDYYNNRVVELQTRTVNFGSANLCPVGQSTPAPCNATIAFNYSLPAGADLGAGSVLTLGSPNLDFSVASGNTCTGRIAAGGTCTMNVTFTPKYAGVRVGSVHLTDDLGNPVATTPILGTGNGPQLAFSPTSQGIVGSGYSNPVAVVMDGAGDVFVADSKTNEVYKVPAGGGKVTTLGTGLNGPAGVAVDGNGNVYIADELNSRVVKVPAAGGTQTTVGTGLSSPAGVAVDGVGNVYIADSVHNNVVKVPAGGDGQQTTVGTGLASPRGVGVDAAGDVFIADSGNGRIVEVPLASGAQFTVVSGLLNPSGVTVDTAGNVYISDYGDNRVLEIMPDAGTYLVLGTGLSDPSGVALDGAGTVYIADTGNDRVLELPRSQAPALSFASTNIGQTSSDSPQAVAVTNIGNEPLTFTALTFPSDFPEGSSLGSGESFCETTTALASGGICYLPVDFKPAQTGALSESLTLTDNALNATSAKQTITLTGTGLGSGTAAAITSPAPSGTLTGSSVTFAWSAGTSVTDYFLSIGNNGVGSRNLYAGAATTARSASVTGLPTDATTIYVRLGSKIAGSWQEVDYTYTAASISSTLTSPAPGSVLSGSSVTFKWTAIGTSDEYFLSLGSKGVGSNNLYNPGATTAKSASVTGLPTNGEIIYARLGSKINGVWKSVDYTYTSAATPAALNSPAPGSTLTGSSVTFSWTAGSGVTEYFLSLGTTGVGSNNLYNPGATTAKSASVTGLPTNGETIYARLGSKINGVWKAVDYTYKAK